MHGIRIAGACCHRATGAWPRQSRRAISGERAGKAGRSTVTPQATTRAERLPTTKRDYRCCMPFRTARDGSACAGKRWAEALKRAAHRAPFTVDCANWPHATAAVARQRAHCYSAPRPRLRNLIGNIRRWQPWRIFRAAAYQHSRRRDGTLRQRRLLTSMLRLPLVARAGDANIMR